MRLFDLHCDTLTVAMNARKSLAHNDLQLDFARGASYRPWIQTMAVFVPDTLRGDAAWDYFDRSARYLDGQLQTELPDVARCTDGASIRAVRDGGGQAVLLAVEGGYYAVAVVLAVVSGAVSIVKIRKSVGKSK